ncbi:alpha/beta fold hydrolase [Azospirillum doebereinerae]
MPLVNVQSGNLWYERQGRGKPLLFVTGLSGNASYWAAQAPLAADRDLITYDHIGVGRSDRPLAGYSVETMARDVVDLLDHLDIGRIDIVGHSTGGCIVQVIAARYPERVGQLLIASSWLASDWRFDRLFRQRRQVLTECGVEAYTRWGALLNYPPLWACENGVALAEMEAVAVGLSSAPVIAGRIDAILDFDGTAYANAIKAPVTLVCARDDQVTPQHMTQALAAALPQASLRWFDTGGHCFTHVHGSAFNTLVGELFGGGP